MNWLEHYIRSSRPELFYKKGALRNFAKFTGKRLCQSLFFNKDAGLSHLKRDSGTGEISKNTFSYRTPLVAASVTFMCFHIRRYMKGERYILTFFLDTIDQLTVSLNAKKLVCLFFSYLLIIRSTYLSESF